MCEAHDLLAEFAETTTTVVDSEIQSFLDDLEGYGVSNPAVPPVLQQLWDQSTKWHLIHDHYNIVSTTKNVFGDESCRLEWRERTPQPNCAGAGWLCFGSFSEYDYLFICVDGQDIDFGCLRWMVNNCCEETPFQGNAEEFMIIVGRFAAAYNRRVRARGTEGEEEEEEVEFSIYLKGVVEP
eukprot:gene671-2102_t